MLTPRVTALCASYLNLVIIVSSSLLNLSSATYLPWNRETKDKSNAVHSDDRSNLIGSNDLRQRTAFFKDDAEIIRYLKGHGRQLKLWSCRNAIQQVYSRHKPVPHIELFCDVIGTIDAVTWSFRGLQLAGTNVKHTHQPSLHTPDVDRYWLTVASHRDNDQYYTTWLDFRLRIYNATRRDSGVYWFEATSPSGDVERHAVFVDMIPVKSHFHQDLADSKMADFISDRKRKKKSEKRSRKAKTPRDGFDTRPTTSSVGLV